MQLKPFSNLETYGCRVCTEEQPIDRQFTGAKPYLAISQKSVIPTEEEAQVLSMFIMDLRSMHGGDPKHSTSPDANPFIVKKLANGTWIGRRSTSEWSKPVAKLDGLKKYF